MEILNYFSQKTKKEIYRYAIVILLAVIIWILQVSVLSNFCYFDITPNLMLLTTVFLGLTCGPYMGIVFGLFISFFVSSIIFDHVFFISYPIIGLLTGILAKYSFSDEMIYFTFLCILFIIPTEYLNGMQYHLLDKNSFIERLIHASSFSILINALIAPVIYFIFSFFTNKLNLR